MIIFEGRHNHPPWPAEKVTQEAKADLQKCLDAYGIYGATAEKLDNGKNYVASHDLEILSTNILTAYIDSSINNCNVRNAFEQEAR